MSEDRVLKLTLLFILIYGVLITLGFYWFKGIHSAIAGGATGLVSATGFIITKNTVKNLFLEKSKFLYTLFILFKFIGIIAYISVSVMVFKFDLYAMLLGFSVVPMSVLTLLAFK